MSTLPLFAVDFGSIATVIVTVVGLVIYAVNQVIEVQKMNQPTPPRNAPGRRTSDPFENPNNMNRPPRAGQRGDEVDTFLRDVTARREQAQPQRRPQPQREPRQRPAQQSSGGNREALSSRDSIGNREPIGSLASQHTIADRAKQFGQRVSDDVSTSDVQPSIERHVQSAFSNQVGTLAGAASEAAMTSGHATHDAVSPFADELRAMLSNPKTLQQAIILQEILTPPAHRWE